MINLIIIFGYYKIYLFIALETYVLFIYNRVNIILKKLGVKYEMGT